VQADFTTQVVEEFHSQLNVLYSEFHKNSRTLSETQAQISNLESDFQISARTIKWMQCKVFDLSRHLSQMGCFIEEAQEKHLLTQHDVAKLAKDLATVRESQKRAPPPGEIQSSMEVGSIEIPHHLTSCSTFSKDFDSTYLYDHSLTNSHLTLEGSDATNLDVAHNQAFQAPMSQDGVMTSVESYDGITKCALEGARMNEACDPSTTDCKVHEIKQQVWSVNQQANPDPPRLLQRQKALGTIPEEKGGHATKNSNVPGVQ